MVNGLVAFFTTTKAGRICWYFIRKFLVRQGKKFLKRIKDKMRDQSANRRLRKALEESTTKEEQQNATQDLANRLGGRS